MKFFAYRIKVLAKSSMKNIEIKMRKVKAVRRKILEAEKNKNLI